MHVTEQTQNILIVLFVAVAIVLGGLILDRETGMISETWDRFVPGSEDTGSLTEEAREQIRNFPQEGAPQEVVLEHAEVVSQFAEAADAVRLKDCSPTPRDQQSISHNRTSN